MKKIIGVGLVFVTSTLLLQQTAAAHVRTLTIDSVAYQKGGGSVVLSGTISCTSGERYRVGGRLAQVQGTTTVQSENIRGAHGRCTGAPTPWRFDVVPNNLNQSFNTTDPATVRVVGESGFAGLPDNSRHGISRGTAASVDIQPQP